MKLESNYIKQGKTAAIIAYITFIGTIIAYFMNSEKRNQFASFHIRQAIGIWILFFLMYTLISPFHSSYLNSFFSIFKIVLMLFGLFSAIREEQEMLPVFGPLFQKWFTFIK